MTRSAGFKRGNYTSFLDSLKEAIQVLGQGAVSTGQDQDHSSQLIILWGDCEFFLNKAAIALRSVWEKKERAAVVLEEEKLNAELLHLIWQSKALFEESSLYIVRRVKKQKELAQLLKGISHKKGESNLLLVVEGDPLLVSLDKELQRLRAIRIPCLAPSSSEIRTLIQHLAKKAGLQIDNSVVDLLCELGSNDLYKIENELSKIALVFCQRKTVITAADIAPILGLLKEEHAFKLSRYLLDKKIVQAQALIRDLLDRGESPLALLGLLAKHYRSTLQIKVDPSVQLGFSPKIPSFLMSSYRQYAHSSSKEKLTRILALCQQADLLLKTSSKLTAEQILQPLCQ